MNKQQKIQLILIFTGLLLFVSTYFFYINLNKNIAIIEDPAKKDFEKTMTGDQITAFENVEYKGIYDLDKPFKVESEEAYILNEDPDLVYMNNMRVILYLNDGRTVKIISDKGSYNKITYDCFFEQNVEATDGTTKIFAENLDLLATENIAKIYNNVNLDYTQGQLRADKIDYDFETKHFKVSMFDDKSIKMKVVQWVK